MAISRVRGGVNRGECDEFRLLTKAARRWKWIFRRGAFEPMAASLSLVMVTGGLNLIFNASQLERTPLLFPLFFAYFLLFLGLCGFVGLSIKNTTLLAIFSFCGLVIRTWMAALYFAANPTDLSWISFACGAIVLFWIFSRVVCDATARRAARRISDLKSQPLK